MIHAVYLISYSASGNSENSTPCLAF